MYAPPRYDFFFTKTDKVFVSIYNLTNLYPFAIKSIRHVSFIVCLKDTC